ncbi:MAG: 2,3-bisphosphoglycerate-independent phosphoglycerate mutase [Vampirovibrionales bacterium]|nr:2,3-bisphosphoglycerate-independent phosphoglycerate mutase [Vampirovibrionales bacterium]
MTLDLNPAAKLQNTPLLLLILDGWGLRPPEDGTPPPNFAEGDAIGAARPEHYWHLMRNHPWVPVDASGLAVGLPTGQMGNSEVGHSTMGAGRVMYMELTRISKAIAEGEFFENPVLMAAVNHAKANNSTLHIMGLVSDGGVHSSLEHLLALIELAKRNDIQKLRFHAFLDGRDVPPKSASGYLKAIEDALLEQEYPQIATISGRYYAMDRDNRWDRTQKAYETLVSAKGERHPFSVHALEMAYRKDETDEFVSPVVTDFTYGDNNDAMADGDAVIFANFRPDRARQLTNAITQADFNVFERSKVLKNLYFACMAEYDAQFELPVAYKKAKLTNRLAEVLSRNGVRQFRTAETEKYAHVTFFFNGGIEQPFAGEDRKLIPSPKVATYDLQPEMSLHAVTESVCEAIVSGQYEVIIANLANPDMVGHTGIMAAAVKAVQAIDTAIDTISKAILAHNGVMLLTADHGNIECMTDAQGGPHTAHTTALVPLLLVSNDPSLTLAPPTEALNPGQSPAWGLNHIAPTMLDLLGLPIPSEMDASVVQKISAKVSV